MIAGTALATEIEMASVYEVDPLEPATLTEKVPLADDEQDRVEVPEPVTLVGVRVQVNPVAGLMLEVRPTNPAKPWTAVTVIVEVPADPTLTATLVGLAAIAKS